MQINFDKYQGTGNDFIIIDQRDVHFIGHDRQKLIERLCDRRFGIGADGLILLENARNSDFRMVYFNSDGKQSSMCGNGGRCIVHFAWSRGICSNKAAFEAIDGIHEAEIAESGKLIRLQMSDVADVKLLEDAVMVMNTGSPHYVSFVDQMPGSIRAAGAEVRYSAPYAEVGINVNFVKMDPLLPYIDVCTYERGVEDETFSCGTGVTASALALSIKNGLFGPQTVEVNTKGGKLSVSFDRQANGFRQIWLSGPAIHVFSGMINV